jgi:hypothetical protein
MLFLDKRLSLYSWSNAAAVTNLNTQLPKSQLGKQTYKTKLNHNLFQLGIKMVEE